MGIDFGTLSCRTVIVNIDTGKEIAASVKEYEHAVMAYYLPCGKKLPADYALQHPQDYLDNLFFKIKDCIENSKIDASDIIGVGVDFTASTILPVDKDSTPLCFFEKFKSNPHAYVKLWKHHAAQPEADIINKLAKDTNQPWLKQYGGTISSEWQFPKILQIVKESPEVYNETFRFIEAGDWIVWKLTGVETHAICAAGFKAIWSEEAGYPDKSFLKTLHPDLENIAETKLGKNILKYSQTAGYITKEIEEKTGLKAGTPVAPALVDAHAAVPEAVGDCGDPRGIVRRVWLVLTGIQRFLECFPS